MTSDIVQSILDERGETTLAHYASPYYDPVKAKEYYERTKQLKGRQQGSATASLSKGQRQAVGYANVQIKNARQNELKGLAAKREAKLKETAERIKQKLEDLIAKRADAILKRMEQLPKNADPKIVARLMANHSKNVNEARAKARTEMAKAVKGVRKDFENARNAVNAKYNKAQTTEQRNIQANVR